MGEQRYFIARIEESNGEWDYGQTIRFRAKPDQNPAVVFESIARNWYSEAIECDGSYEHPCEEWVTWYADHSTITELTKYVFDKLTILADCTNAQERDEDK